MVSLTQISKTDNNNESPFEYIRRADTDGNEFWLGRELMELLGYQKWERFCETIERAEESLEFVVENTSEHISRHICEECQKGRPKEDIKMSSLGLLFTIFNCDPRKNKIKHLRNIFLSRVAFKDIFHNFDFQNENESIQDKSGFVYLVKQSINGYCKIGKSKKPYKRYQTLQTGNPLEIVIVERIFSFNCSKLERSLHRYFSDYWLRGEWFNLSDNLISSFGEIALELDRDIEAKAIESAEI